MPNADRLRLRDTIIAHVPDFPGAIALGDLAAVLQTKRGITILPGYLAATLKTQLLARHVCQRGARQYTRPRTAQERQAALTWPTVRETLAQQRHARQRARQARERERERQRRRAIADQYAQWKRARRRFRVSGTTLAQHGPQIIASDPQNNP